MDIPWFVWLIGVLVLSYAFYQMVIVPGQEVSGAVGDLAGTAADVGGDILQTHGDIITGTVETAKKAGEAAKKAGEAVVKAATKECRAGFVKVGFDCLAECPYGTNGLYCKKDTYTLGTYKVDKASHSCNSGYRKLNWPSNKTCEETSCKSGYRKLNWPRNKTCQSDCPQYTKKDWTGGCKRKPQRHWF